MKRLKAILVLMSLLCGFGMLPDSARTETVLAWPVLLQQQELLRAEQFGLDIRRAEQKSISGQELMELLDQWMKIASPDRLPQWETQLMRMRDDHRALKRIDAMAGIYLASRCAGGCFIEIQEDPFESTFFVRIDWDHTALTSGLFDDMPQNYNMGYGTWDLSAAAFYFNFTRASRFSGQYPFGVVGNENALYWEQNASYAECVIAAVRLVDAIQESRLSEQEDAAAFAAIFSPDLLEKARNMPSATSEQHPQWTGFALLYELYEHDATPRAIHDIADWGFNFVRLYCDYRELFDPEDLPQYNQANIHRLDQLIATGIERGVHIDLCLSQLPGHAVSFEQLYDIGTDWDLFVNTSKQQQAEQLWEALAIRYQDIPSSALSFSPIFEPTNGVFAVNYGIPEIAAVTRHMIESIRQVSPERLIMFEATGVSADVTDSPSQVLQVLDGIDNLILMRNYAEDTFLYYNMMDQPEYNNADDVKHTMELPTYPTYLYAVNTTITPTEPLFMEGCLPADTEIRMHVRSSQAAKMMVDGDGKTIFEKQIGTGSYQVETPLSREFPYAESNVVLSFKLTQDTDRLSIQAVQGRFTWSGIEVILPQAYATTKWCNVTPWDVHLGLEKKAGTFERTSSVVKIAPTPLTAWQTYDENTITIWQDVRYSTGTVAEEASPAHAQRWARQVADTGVSCMIRYERGDFSGAAWEDVSRYYEAALDAFSQYDFSWISNDFAAITGKNDIDFPGSTRRPYDGYEHFNLELLEWIKRYQ